MEWIAKAEGDFATMQREMQVQNTPNYDAVCFHAQQCAEKYLKAQLQEAGIPFTKSHDLSVLLDALLPRDPGWNRLRPALELLTDFAVSYRYPGECADESLAREALTHCCIVREELRQSLGILK